MKKIITFAGFMIVILSSCKSLIPFNDLEPRLQKVVLERATEVQFYADRDIVIRQDTGSFDVDIKKGVVLSKKKVGIDDITVRHKTAGLASGFQETNSQNNDDGGYGNVTSTSNVLFVTFDPKGQSFRFLEHTVPGRKSKVLQLEVFTNRKLLYGETFYPITEGIGAGLLLSKKMIQKFSRTSVTAKGNKLRK